jgi:hypothetical protein
MDWPLLLLCLGSFVFAVSSVVRIGELTLIDWPLQNPLLGVFRSSGRFIWIAYYAVMVLALWRLTAIWPRAATLIMIAVIAAQMWEAQPIHRHFARTRITTPPDVALKDPRWGTLIDGRRHLVQLPPPSCDTASPSTPPIWRAGIPAKPRAIATVSKPPLRTERWPTMRFMSSEKTGAIASMRTIAMRIAKGWRVTRFARSPGPTRWNKRDHDKPSGLGCRQKCRPVKPPTRESSRP